MLFILIRYFPILLFLAAGYFWLRARELNLPEKRRKIYGWFVIGALLLQILLLLGLGLSQ